MSDAISTALAAKYALPYYVFLEQVRDATGFDSKRSADAIAVGLYRSRGRDIHGFEYKISRSDWLRELKQPEKAEEIGRYCDYFHLVINDPKIAQVAELPIPWGLLLVTDKGKIKTLKRAEKIDAAPISRPLMCSLLYTTMHRYTQQARAAFDGEVQAQVKREHAALLYRVTTAEGKSERLEQKIAEFEQASGIPLHWHEPKKVGEAVRIVLSKEHPLKRHRSQLEWIVQQCKTLSVEVERELGLLNEELQKEEDSDGKQTATAAGA